VMARWEGEFTPGVPATTAGADALVAEAVGAG
jgi:hypothetical protein